MALQLSILTGEVLILTFPDGSIGTIRKNRSGLALDFDDDIRIDRAEFYFDRGEELPDGFLPVLPSELLNSGTPDPDDMPRTRTPNAKRVVKDRRYFGALRDHLWDSGGKRTDWFKPGWFRDELGRIGIGAQFPDLDNIWLYAWEKQPLRNATKQRGER